MKQLHLANGLALPLKVVTEKLAWLGRTGSGKTYGAQKLAELMLEAGAQVGAIDPVGVWPALRIPKTKGGTSFEVVVFGGLRGDLPLEPTAGVLIADLVCDRGLSFVLDISQFIPAEQQRFVQAFADRFFHRKKSAPSAVHLFMEECQEYIPENPTGEEAKTLGVMQRLWKLGRNFGIGGSLISQRPQEISKKALNMSGTLFAFQMTGPQERKAIKAWVADKGVEADIESVLQKLEVGAPHVESPMFLEISKTVRILPKVTADLSSTPEVGVATAAKRPLTPIDVEQLTAAMAATIEKAKENDPRELKRQNAELRAQLAKVQSAKPAAAGKAADPAGSRKQVATIQALRRALEVAMKFIVQINAEGFLKEGAPADREAIQKALEAALQSATRIIDQRLTARNREIERLKSGAAKLAAGLKAVLKDDVTVDLTVRHNEPFTVAAPRPAHVVRHPAPRPAGNGNGSAIGSGERAVLTAVAQHEAGVSREQLSILTGYKRSSRDTYLQRLRSGGYVDQAGETIVATQAGLDALGPDFAPLPTGEALREHWLGRLPEGERRIFEIVVGAYPKPVDREAISEATSYKRSSRDTYLQRLSARKLVRAVGRGDVQAADELF